VVGRHEPPGEKAPVVLVVMPVNGCVRHEVPPLEV
jgi:hypothetical protein